MHIISFTQFIEVVDLTPFIHLAHKLFVEKMSLVTAGVTCTVLNDVMFCCEASSCLLFTFGCGIKLESLLVSRWECVF